MIPSYAAFVVNGLTFEPVLDVESNWQGAMCLGCGGEFRTVGRDAIAPEDHVCEAVDDGYLPAGCQVGNQCIFDEGDGVHTSSLGVVTRVWENRKYVSLRSDGRIFTRLIQRVRFCDHKGHERDNLAGWPPDYACLDCSDTDNDINVAWFEYDPDRPEPMDMSGSSRGVER